ncbi:hypothetical protein EDD11_002056 [Mortierella claussenii]|nr:hypothetical protein EDD11_002056 [Mortierella claussenii]
MENSFWNKFKKTIMTTPKAQPTSAQQLSRFNKCWLTIQVRYAISRANAELHTVISTPEKRKGLIQQTEIPVRLKNMVDLLVDEESRLDDAIGSTGVCMESLLKNNILAKLVNTCAEGDQPRGIMGETIRTMASMINLLDDRFLVHNAVHKPTVKLLRACCAPGTELEDNEGYHEDLIDLMYILCSKIHGYPELLNIFFYDRQWLTVPERLAARRLRRSRETIALLRSLSVRSNLTLTTVDNDSRKQNDDNDEERKTGELPRNFFKDPAETDAHIETPSPSPDDRDDDLESKRDYEFLLFTYLSKFVHREGKAGDFARTGLLFLMELATGSLGEYIMDSEFATYLTAGVGALYSQLPRKLIVKGGPSDLVGGSGSDSKEGEEIKSSRRLNIELSTSGDFQSRLDAFLKVLGFCQDILMRCPNVEIASTLLSSFKTVFLENILYPSMMECADTDGSAVAVITYMDQILQILEHESLVDLVVGFLMESEEDNARAKTLEETDAFAEVQNPQMTSPYFTATGRFTLKDLVLSRLKSRSQATVIATLKLLNTIITHHCKYSLKLLTIQPDNRASLAARDQLFNGANARDPYREVPKISHHAHELDLFFALVATINPKNTIEIFCSGYEAYLLDAEGLVETHQCLIRPKEDDCRGTVSDAERKKQRRRSIKYGHRMDTPNDQQFIETIVQDQEKISAKLPSCCRAVPMHHLMPSDPLLQILLGILSHFFAHTVELNLALTGVITSLAICPFRSLEGWLLFRASDVKRPDVDRGSDEESEVESSVSPTLDLANSPSTLYDSDNESMSIFARATPDTFLPPGPPSFKSFPPFFTMLRTLTQQVDYYRSEIDGFDEYLAERRRMLFHMGGSNTAISTAGTASTAAGIHPTTAHSIDQPVLGISTFNPGATNASSDSLSSTSSRNMVESPHTSAPTDSGSRSNLLGGGGPPGPCIVGSGGNSNSGSKVSSSASQRSFSKTSALPVGNEGAGNLVNSVIQVKINTPRARKSSSPSSLMSTPSNIPFLIPSGVSGKRSFKSISASPLAGVYGDAESSSSASQSPARNVATPPGSTSQARALWPTSTPVAVPAAGPSKAAGGATTIGGMAIAVDSSSNFFAQGPGNNSSAFSIPNHSSVPSHAQSQLGSVATNPLARIMDTMKIKPLFGDNFLDDSDCEAEATLQARVKLNEELLDDDDRSSSSISGKNDNSSIRSDDREGLIEREVNCDLQESSSSRQSSQKRKNACRPASPAHSGPNDIINKDKVSSSQPPSYPLPPPQSHQHQRQLQEKMVTLGQLLTNVVILEEVVKEVVAVAQVRRAMGLDKVRFL